MPTTALTRIRLLYRHHPVRERNLTTLILILILILTFHLYHLQPIIVMIIHTRIRKSSVPILFPCLILIFTRKTNLVHIHTFLLPST